MYMSHIRLVLWKTLALLLLLIGVPAYASQDTDLMGIYEIFKIQQIGGGITSAESANKWIGTVVCIQERIFSIRDYRLSKPFYKKDIVRLPKKEGEVIPKELSLFYGIEGNRKSIERLLVFEKKSEPDPIEKLELLDNGDLLEIYDGWVLFFRKKTQVCQ
jgi:hypothetical protein